MGLIQEGDVGKLLQDGALMDQVVAALVEDNTTMDNLADDIADLVQDSLQDDPIMRQKLVSAAIANEAFKRRLVTKLISDLQ